MMNQYAHPGSLVETGWLAEHLADSDLRIIESDEDTLLHGSGHIPGATQVDWHADLNDPRKRDYINAVEFAALASRLGITPETTVIFYGDKANWWAAYALWAFRLFGHERVKLLNGGRAKWIAEGRELSRETPGSSQRRTTRRHRSAWIAAHGSSRPMRSRKTRRANRSSACGHPGNFATD